MSALAHIAPTVGKLVRLLGSDKDHEALGAARALKRVLTSVSLDLHDLANVIEFAARREAPQLASTATDDDNVREMVRCCHEHSETLTSKELAFVHSMAKWRGEPTKRQMAWLSSLYERCMKGEHA
jgi:hypothetical protein